MIAIKYIDRFWSYVEVRGPDECWPWLKCKSRYGYFGVSGKVVSTHRFAYELKHGEGSANGHTIRHTCDNPPCCNPKHLIRGTNQDNMNDKIIRGRARNLKGDECSWKKLTSDQVIMIRTLVKAKIYNRIIAEIYNVDPVTITDIKLGRTWRHLS